MIGDYFFYLNKIVGINYGFMMWEYTCHSPRTLKNVPFWVKARLRITWERLKKNTVKKKGKRLDLGEGAFAVSSDSTTQNT